VFRQQSSDIPLPFGDHTFFSTTKVYTLADDMGSIESFMAAQPRGNESPHEEVDLEINEKKGKTMETFIGFISPFPYTFAPSQWAMCQGQLLPIEQYTALFSLLGTNFGGDGRSVFGLPDLQGKQIIGLGTSHASGTTYTFAQTGGMETVTLTPM
jgi:hypothetical protein